MPTAEDTLFQRFGKEFPKGTVLFHEGEAGKEMFVLQAGRVVITKTVRDTVKILATLGPGEFFGEMALISNRPRNATATVDEPARLLVIDPKTFEGMIRGNTEIAVRMIKKLAERLDEADAQIENLLLADPSSRVVHQILHACQTRGRPMEEGVEIDFNVRELPTLTGVGEPGIRAELARHGAERAGGAHRRPAPGAGHRAARGLPAAPRAALEVRGAMRLRVLGCHGGELPGCRSTCFLVDGTLALDAGALTASLELPALSQGRPHRPHPQPLRPREGPAAAVRPGGRLAEDADHHLGEPRLRADAAGEHVQRRALARLHPHPARRRSRCFELRELHARARRSRPARTPCARCW